MSERAARPRSVKHSETLDRLNRLKIDFACKPFGDGNDRWAHLRVANSPSIFKKAQEKAHKHMIKEVNQGVKGLSFPAEEMALIIRGWMAQDD